MVGALIDDELEPRLRERVLAHLEDCTDCLRDLETLARLQRSLARLGAAP